MERQTPLCSFLLLSFACWHWLPEVCFCCVCLLTCCLGGQIFWSSLMTACMRWEQTEQEIKARRKQSPCLLSDNDKHNEDPLRLSLPLWAAFFWDSKPHSLCLTFTSIHKRTLKKAHMPLAGPLETTQCRQTSGTAVTTEAVPTLTWNYRHCDPLRSN